MLLHRWSIGLRIIAIFEIVKGLLALGAFLLVVSGRYTIRGLCERIVHGMHLDPEGGPAGFLLNVVAQLNPWALAWLGIAYITIRFTEAYGLWRERKWGEWLAAVAAAIYIPVEVTEIVRHPSWREVATLGANIGIVAFLSWVIWKSRKRRAQTQSGATESTAVVL